MTEFPNGFIPFPDFAEQYDLTEDAAWTLWFRHLDEQRYNRIIKIDLPSGDIVEIVSGNEETLPIILNPNMVYKGILYFYHNGAIMSYSLKDTEIKELVQISNIVNIFALDGRIFHITNEENGDVYFFYYVLESGRSYRLVNEGNREYMVLSIHNENSYMFMGLLEGYRVLIYKEDFYNEYYHRVITLQ